MPIRQSTIQRFTQAFQNFNVSSENNKVVLECKDCHYPQHLEVRLLTRRITNGFKTVCTSFPCSPVNVTGNFENLGFRNIECRDCGLVYILNKKVRYFECYCKLKAKQTEHHLYKELFNNGFQRLSKESYWDRRFTNHKCDILVRHEGRFFFIEVDDASHDNNVARERDRVFNETFLANRLEDEYLIRVTAARLDNPDYIDDIIQKIRDPNIQPLEII